MSQAIVTSRGLRNVETGIDVTVPEFKEVSSLMGLSKEEEFNIIVISRLPYFKRACHQTGDTVQFMVTRKFSEFETFRKAMDDKFSATVFPELPKKSLVLSDSISASKRRSGCEELLQFIASSRKLCCSHPFLEFLGVKTSKISEIEEGSPLSQEQQPTVFKKVKVKSTTSDLFGEGNDSDDDLFDELDSAKPREKDDLFADGDPGNDQGTADKILADHNVRLFADDDSETGVYIPPGAAGDNAEDVLEASEDTSDLLNIDDDLDALLLKAKPKSSQRPSPASFSSDTKSKSLDKTTNMAHPDTDLDSDDIMKYIADNSEVPSESLF